MLGEKQANLHDRDGRKARDRATPAAHLANAMPISIHHIIRCLIRRERSLSTHLSGKLDFSGDLAARVKHSFSRQHFSAAEFFSEEASRIESSGPDQSEVERSNHRAYVTGAIFSAVAALESSINELYLEAKDKDKTALAGLTDADLSALEGEWASVESQPTLEKYQEALKRLGRPELDRGSNPFQDADSLIYLRNALIHYKPEWDDETKIHAKIRARLNKKFALNTLSDPNSLWFPHQCMGAGCAAWSLDTTRAFVVEFCKRMGLAPRL
jgi:hypothetical protein